MWRGLLNFFSGIASTPVSTSCSESKIATESEAPWLKEVTWLTNVEEPPGLSSGIARSPVSISCSESDTRCASCSESDSNKEGGGQFSNSQSAPSMVEKDFVQRLCNTVVKECSFLRISSTKLCYEVSKRAKRHGSIATLRIYVDGLPLIKRAKWSAPLIWSVSAVLQRQGCSSKVQNKELYVLVNYAHVRIDLVAARA